MSKNYKYLSKLWSSKFTTDAPTVFLHVDSKEQKLYFYRDEQDIKIYPVSTAKNGLGNTENSFKTPHGFLQISEKIGEMAPKNMVFKGRQATGELAIIDDVSSREQDTITSRILWLSGLEVGINLSQDVDTKLRYIYIHGTADEAHLGQPVSHGCIRMKNTHIIELFNHVETSTVVYID